MISFVDVPYLSFMISNSILYSLASKGGFAACLLFDGYPDMECALMYFSGRVCLNVFLRKKYHYKSFDCIIKLVSVGNSILQLCFSVIVKPNSPKKNDWLHIHVRGGIKKFVH